jgi:hypothetical protein
MLLSVTSRAGAGQAGNGSTEATDASDAGVLRTAEQCVVHGERR